MLRALREQLPEDQRVHLQFAFTVLHEVDTRLEQADLLESERLLQLLIDGSAKNDQLTRAYPLLVRTQLTLARLDQASKTIDAGIGREIAQEELLSLREQLEVQRAARDEIGKVVNRDGMEQEDSG